MHGVLGSFENDTLLQARKMFVRRPFRHAVIDGEEFVIFVLFLFHPSLLVINRIKSIFA